MSYLELFAYAFFCVLGILIYCLWHLVRSIGFKSFWYEKVKRTDYTRVIAIDSNNMPSLHVAPLELHGTRKFIAGKNQQFGYSPIAYKLAIIEQGNAIPYVSGGYVEQNVQKKALKDLNINQTPEQLLKPETPKQEETVNKVFKWIITKTPSALKKCIIKPNVKWSSKELKGAIKSKVIIDLLKIPLGTFDLLLIIGLLGVACISIYFGYTQSQTLKELSQTIEKLAEAISQYPQP